MNGLLKSWHENNFKILLSLLFVFGEGHALMGSVEHDKGRGLALPTPAEKAHIQNQWPKVKQVNLNHIGAARVKADLKRKKQQTIDLEVISSLDNEIISYYGFFEEMPSNNNIVTFLPSSVNNSLRPSFPPIGDQQQLGSSVAWASTYYQATHEIGFLNGYYNKGFLDRVLSPKWTYNLLSGGSGQELSLIDAYQILVQNGAPSFSDFPYDSQDLAWDLDRSLWIAALPNRIAQPQLVGGIGGESQDLTLIKGLLNNGHVLTMGTYIDSWVYTTVLKDPTDPNAPHVGEQAISWMQGRDGAHCLTIVGYDDDIWIDVNGDGKVDPGEKGAFLLANSWGEGWGNKGFIWVAYDAFLAKSGVSEGPNSNRVPLAEAFDHFVVTIAPKAINYQPILIAEFDLLPSPREKIEISAGLSSTKVTTPAKIITSFPLINKDGDNHFLAMQEKEGEASTFAIDLTDLIPDDPMTRHRYYLTLDKDSAGFQTTLNSFVLVNRANKNRINYKNVPLVDGSRKIFPYIDYGFVHPQSGEDHLPPEVHVAYPLKDSILRGQTDIIVHATDDVAIQRVDIYMDEEMLASHPVPPYSVTIDSNDYGIGGHTITAIAYDTSGNQAQTRIRTSVKRPMIPLYQINAGMTDDLSFMGMSTKDQFFTPSHILKTDLVLGDPVYNTARYGRFSYDLEVPNGHHQVMLNFAEPHFKIAGQRVFNVRINGKEVITHLDLVKKVGFGRAYNVTVPVIVTDNHIKIDFDPVIDNALINGIKIY